MVRVGMTPGFEGIPQLCLKAAGQETRNFCQDDGKGGLSFRGVGVTTETPITTKTVTVASLSCNGCLFLLYFQKDQQKEGKVFSSTATTVIKATPLNLNSTPYSVIKVVSTNVNAGSFACPHPSPYTPHHILLFPPSQSQTTPYPMNATANHSPRAPIGTRTPLRKLQPVKTTASLEGI